MTLRRGGGLLLGIVAILLLVTTLGSCGSSVRGFVKDKYERTGSRNGAEVYRARGSVPQVTREITDKWKPADRITSPEGVFLRYGDDFVAVHPAKGGTEVEVADERRGYGLWFPYVGGWFGSGGSRVGGVRGGGPGTGK